MLKRRPYVSLRSESLHFPTSQPRRRFAFGLSHDGDFITALDSEAVPGKHLQLDSDPKVQQGLWASWAILAEETPREDTACGNWAAEFRERLLGNQECGQQQNARTHSRSGNVAASLLKRLWITKALCDVRRIHAQISRLGYDCNTFVGNSLVQMYAKRGSVSDAQAVFDGIANPNLHSWTILINAFGQNGNLGGAVSVFAKMPYRNVVSWTTMIGLLSQNGHGKEALGLFHQMEVEGVKPNKITFVCTIDACTSLAVLEEGLKVHAAVVNFGCDQDVVVGTALVTMYGKCKNLNSARSVFGRMSHRNVVSWTAMIAVFVQHGQSKDAIDLFQQMQFEGIKPNNVTLVCVLDACSDLAALYKGREIHSVVVDNGFEHDLAVCTALLDMYGKCGSLCYVRSIFDNMPHRCIASWNAVIGAFAMNDHANEALDLFYQMLSNGFKPDNVTYVSCLDACANLAALEEGRWIHVAIVHSDYIRDIVVGNALVNMYGKCKREHDARSVFDRMSDRDVISWNAMTTALAQTGHGEKALDIFRQMLAEGVTPVNITFITALDACASLPDLADGQKFHAVIAESKYGENMMVGTSLVSMYGKCGSLHNAKKVFERIPHHDVVSWNALIAALSQNGYGLEALHVFHRMQLEAVRPTSITYKCVLTACSRTGLVAEGWEFLLSMRKHYGIMQTRDHYGCMVDLLGRAGLLEEAENLINNVPVKLDAVTWLSLLGACRIHGDAERGVHAANESVDLAPKTAAPYVILSNIYASASMKSPLEREP